MNDCTCDYPDKSVGDPAQDIAWPLDYPVSVGLLERRVKEVMSALDITIDGLATEDFVKTTVASATEGLATEDFVNSAVSSATEGLATESYVDGKVRDLDLSGYLKTVHPDRPERNSVGWGTSSTFSDPALLVTGDLAVSKGYLVTDSGLLVDAPGSASASDQGDGFGAGSLALVSWASSDRKTRTAKAQVKDALEAGLEKKLDALLIHPTYLTDRTGKKDPSKGRNVTLVLEAESEDAGLPFSATLAWWGLALEGQAKLAGESGTEVADISTDYALGVIRNRVAGETPVELHLPERNGTLATKEYADSLMDGVDEALEGKADLVDGKIPVSQLPSYVSDVIEYASRSAFPAKGEAAKIYVAKDTNLTYRWSGTGYVEISPSLAVGETAGTAYDGAKGKALDEGLAELKGTVDAHVADMANPHGVTAAQAGAVPTSRTVNGRALSADITLAASDVSAVPTSRTVNGRALSADVTLSAGDVGALPATKSGDVYTVAPATTFSKTVTVAGVTGEAASAAPADALDISPVVSGGSVGVAFTDGKGAKTSTLIPDGSAVVTAASLSSSLGTYATKDEVPNVPSWALQDTKPTYTAAEVGALASTVTHLSGDVPVTRRVNGKELSSDIALTASDVGAVSKSDADEAYAPKAGPLETATSKLTADGVLTKLVSGDAADWKTEDGTLTFVEDVSSRQETEDIFTASFCWPSVDDAQRVLTYGWSWATGGSVKVVETFFCQYDTEDGSYVFPDNYSPDEGDGKTVWTEYYNSDFATGTPKSITFTSAMSEDGLPAVTLVREGWKEVADLSNAFMSSPVDGDGSRFGWEFGALSVPRQLVYRIGRDGKRSAFAIRSQSGNIEMKFQTGTSDLQGGNLFVGNVNASKEDGTIGDCNVRATGDVVANAHHPVPVSLLSLNSDYTTFKENFSSSVSTIVTNSSPVTDVQISADGSSYSTCVDGKVAKVDLSAYMKKTDTTEDATTAHALSFLGSDWYNPTSAFIGMFRDTGDSYTPINTIEGADTATSFGVFCPGKGMSMLIPDASPFMTEKRCNAKYQTLLAETSTVSVAGVTLNALDAKKWIVLRNATNNSEVASRIYGVGDGKITFGRTELADLGSTLTVDGSDVLTESLARTIFAAKSDVKTAQFAVADGKPTAIEHGKFYSFKPNSTEDAALTLSTGFDDGEEDEARLFFDCGTAAPSVTFPSDVTVLYEEGSVKLDAMTISGNSVPNRYMAELKWFKTSASGTPVKYVVVNCRKVTEG